ncbi:hypothetical protein JOB18_025188 [Solea senegalensis]|uniref:Uncharacterized protein n=1 Tax=Solea senegalensis TaxID=28829 RepID=A0AAV6Q0H2_SOLSE|nr:hypothetical protein JOB18_025188 [Solea senegalensis]
MSRSPSASSEGSKITGESSAASSDDPGEGPSNHYHYNYKYNYDEDELSSEDDYL